MIKPAMEPAEAVLDELLHGVGLDGGFSGGQIADVGPQPLFAMVCELSP